MERKLQQLIDRQEITDLIHDYCIHVDQYEPEKVAALFTEDCITDFGKINGGEVLGRRRVERGCRYTLAGWDATSHRVSNIRLWFEDDDDVRGVTYLHAWHRPYPGQPSYHIYARYNDRFTQTDQGWRFCARRLSVFGQEGRDGEFDDIDRHTPDPELVAKVRSRM